MKRIGINQTMKSHMLLLSAYSRAGNVAKYKDIVYQMQESGLEPDTFVINSMLNLYGRLGQFEKLEEILKAMERGPYSADISTYNILINVYERAGYFEWMEELFEALPTKNLKPDVVTWTSRLEAYSKKKLYTRCLEIFEERIDSGCYPDRRTAKVLLSAYSSDEQIEQVTTVIRTMHKDMSPAMPTWCSLPSALCIEKNVSLTKIIYNTKCLFNLLPFVYSLIQILVLYMAQNAFFFS